MAEKKAADAKQADLFEFEPIKGYPMLRWQGKRPFRHTQYYPAQLKEVHGQEVNGWRNKIYWGDNLQVMSHLLREFRGKVNLIYIDPPYDSKATYKKNISVDGTNTTNDHSTFEEKQYDDIWNNDEYLQFIHERLVIARELLSENAVICIHCDWHRGHHVRCILDEIFGPEKFVNELVWYYYNKMQGNINKFASNHDIIICYAKSNNFTFNKIQEAREETVKQIKRIWDKKTSKIVNAKDENGNIIYIESTHRTIDDVWRISMLQPADKTEPLGYPTQKPEALLERVVTAFSNEGDLVFDCFMGSGTTQAVAMKLRRRFIGADINLGSIQITTKRLLTLAAGQQRDLSTPVKWSGFEVYNVNHYDVFRNPAQAKDLLREALDIEPLPESSVFDGRKDGRMVKLMPINRIATRTDLNELVANLDYKSFEREKAKNSRQPVLKLLLVCMGHEPDLKSHLLKELAAYKVDVEVVDVLRDHATLEFKRDSQAKIRVKKGHLYIEQFFPMNLLQKLSLRTEEVGEWRELVESVMIDWNYDDVVFQPSLVDIPDKEELVKGTYAVPPDAGKIRVKITDLLSESLEMDIEADRG